MFRYISRVFARQVIRRIAVIAVGALFMLVPALWGGLQAHAASVYDNAWHTTDTLSLGVGGCESQDITLDFYSQAIENAGNDTNNWQQSLTNAISSGGRWITSIDKRDFSTQNVFYIYWTEDTSLELEWRTSGTVGATGNNIYGIQMMMAETDCNLYSYYLAPNQNNFVSSVRGASQEYTASYFHIDEEQLNIPEGYEGNPVESPVTPEPPLSGENYAPDWRILTANNWRAEIRDYRFVTFDGIPWTCSEDGNSIQPGHEGLAPVIEWELYDKDNNLIDDGILSATAHWNYQFDEHNVERTYTIKGRYDCGGSVNFVTFGEKQFTITETGLLKEQDFFAQCVMLEPPFIDVQACIENVFRVIEIMAFNQITLVQGLNSTENCRQLVVLGHWINKPYEVVCPQFSQTVRNTVTPFVTFILGLLTALVIVRFMNNRGLS